MGKMNMRKKIVAALMAANGISAISDGNLNAVVRTMKEFQSPLSEHVIYTNNRIGIEKNWFDYTKLKTKSELEQYLNDHREDIFYTMHEGDENRRKANQKLAAEQEILLKALQRRKKTKNGKQIIWRFPDTKTMREKAKAFEKKNHKKLSKKLRNVMLANAAEGPERNWAALGRGYLHDDDTDIKKASLEKELKRAEKGTVNCTVWAELINWFLNENEYPASLMSTEGHRFVVTPVKDENEKTIRLCYTSVDESANSLDETPIKLHHLCTRKLNEKTWNWVIYPWTTGHTGNDDLTMSPTYTQFRGIEQNYFVHNIPASKMAWWIRGLQKDYKYWESKGEIRTDKQNNKRTYNFKILPWTKNYIYVPLNLEYIGEATELQTDEDKKMYTNCLAAKHPGLNGQTQFLYTQFKLRKGELKDEWKNGTLELSINPKNLMSPKAIIKYKDKSGIEKEDKLSNGFTPWTDDNNPATGFWNDPNYKDQEIKTKTEKK